MTRKEATMALCPDCGKEGTPAAKFCPDCGRALWALPPPPTAPVAPPKAKKKSHIGFWGFLLLMAGIIMIMVETVTGIGLVLFGSGILIYALWTDRAKYIG